MRIKARLALRASLAVVFVACAPTGSGGDTCNDPPATGPRCCDASAYDLATLSDIANTPGAYIGRHVEVVGLGQWYQDQRQGAECVCADNACGCVVPLGLYSASCGMLMPLTGDYRGRPVQCGTDGCWPLTVMQRYAVCGSITPGDSASLGTMPVLSVDAVCQM